MIIVLTLFQDFFLGRGNDRCRKELEVRVLTTCKSYIWAAPPRARIREGWRREGWRGYGEAGDREDEIIRTRQLARILSINSKLT